MAERITEEFKQKVAKYIELSDQLTEFNKKTKSIRDTKKSLEDEIKQFMVDEELFNLNLNKSGTLSISTRKVIKKVGKQDIIDVLLETIKEEDQRDSIINKAFPDEETDEVVSLKRKKSKI